MTEKEMIKISIEEFSGFYKYKKKGDKKGCSKAVGILYH